MITHDTHHEKSGASDPPSSCSVPCLKQLKVKPTGLKVHWHDPVNIKPKSSSILYPTKTVAPNNSLHVVPDVRSPHGTVQGTFTTITPTSKCTILGNIVPMWAFVVESFGLIVHQIQLTSPAWLAFCRQLWPKATVTTNDRVDREYSLNPYIFCDHTTFPGLKNSIWIHAKVIMVYSIEWETKLLMPKNWKITRTLASHALTGGCTNGYWTVAVLCKYNIQTVTRPDLPQRQLAGAWNSLHDGTSAKVVQERTNNEVGVHRLDEHTISTWGLCPVTTASTTFVVGPGTFSSTKFVRRRLKASELFLAWDLPLHVVEQSSVKFLKRNVDTIMASPPCKILQGVGAAWFNREKPGGRRHMGRRRHRRYQKSMNSFPFPSYLEIDLQSTILMI